MAKDITYWAVMLNKEGTETMFAAFTTQQEAQTYVNAQKGEHGYRVRQSTLRLFDSAFELQPTLNKAARISGLKKLTVEERDALGLGHIHLV